MTDRIVDQLHEHVRAAAEDIQAGPLGRALNALANGAMAALTPLADRLCG